GMTLEQAIAALHQSRAELLAWFDEQEDDSFLDQSGRHPMMRILSLYQIITVMAQHEIGHTNDILAMLDPS
ncbi:MAG: DinB family protein, partial [Anaerolineae bacterium]|nr:DinB family protein [Anaerolineae bacterium]